MRASHVRDALLVSLISFCQGIIHSFNEIIKRISNVVTGLALELVGHAGAYPPAIADLK